MPTPAQDMRSPAQDNRSPAKEMRTPAQDNRSPAKEMRTPAHEMVVGQPHPALAGIVARYVGYRFEGLAPGVHHALPSGTLTFVITLDGPLEMLEMPDPAQSPASHDLLVGGLHQRRGLIAHHGHQHGIQIELAPLGARRVLARPAADLAHRVVDALDVLGSASRELHARLLEHATWGERFAVLDEVLTRALADRARQPRGQVAWVWQQLVRSGGRVAIADLAEEVGWSGRHLSSQFRAEMGLTPKAASRVLRFDRARRLLGGPRPMAIASVAAECGYADQAHMTRDFQEIAGESPAALFHTDELLGTQPTR